MVRERTVFCQPAAPLVVLAVLLRMTVAAQPSGSFSVMTWNLLNWPNTSDAVVDSTGRNPHFRTVVEYVDPDILVTQENQATYSTTWFLNAVMNNRRAGVYRQGNYIHGPDSNNGLFYRDSLFRFVSNVPIETPLRDINEYTLVYKPGGDTLRIYVVHLKASTGSSNENQRAEEVDSLRKVTNRLPDASDFLVCGDFNIYGDYESAFQKLLQDQPGNDGQVIDVLNLSGIWNDPAFAPYHTQSTRLNPVGGGSFGGMDDRFDMILVSDAVVRSGGMYYLPGTCEAVGNDGNHYNESINAGFNSAVPAGVADALYWASDHLPVILRIQPGTSPGVDEVSRPPGVLRVFPNPAGAEVQVRVDLGTGASGAALRLVDFSGRIVGERLLGNLNQGLHQFNWKLPDQVTSGVYLLLFSANNILINNKLYIIK